MDNLASLDDMWKEIENYGLDRKVLDPHKCLSASTVDGLYRTIKGNQ